MFLKNLCLYYILILVNRPYHDLFEEPHQDEPNRHFIEHKS
jgi:hypothetical protein